MSRYGMFLLAKSTGGRTAVLAGLLVCTGLCLPACDWRIGQSGDKSPRAGVVIPPASTTQPTSSPADKSLAAEKFLAENFVVDPADSLAKLKYNQPMLAIFPPGDMRKDSQSGVAMMGKGESLPPKVLEINSIRTVVAIDWFFRQKQTNWPGLSDRYVRWTHVFYADGRRVTTIELNNAGGAAIASSVIDAGVPVAWSDGQISANRVEPSVVCGVGRWSFMLAAERNLVRQQILLRNYTSPAKVELQSGDADAFSPGDVDKDRFDQAQGFYYIRMKDGRCGFKLIPPAGGLLNPAFFVPCDLPEDSRGLPIINIDGMTVKNFVQTGEGLLFEISDQILAPITIEVGWQK